MARENDAARPRISSWRSARPSSEIITCNGMSRGRRSQNSTMRSVQKAVRRDVDQCRTQRRRGRFCDLRQVAPDERLAAREPDDVHPRQRRKDPPHLVERQVAGVVLSPGVAHDAARVAREGDGVGEHAWQRRPFEMPVDHRAHDARPTQQRRHTSATSGETVSGRNGASAASAAPLPFIRGSRSARGSLPCDPGTSRSYAIDGSDVAHLPRPLALEEVAVNPLFGVAGLRERQDRLAEEQRFAQQLVARGRHEAIGRCQVFDEALLVDRQEAEVRARRKRTEPVAANLAPGCDERIQQTFEGEGAPHVDHDVDAALGPHGEDGRARNRTDAAHAPVVYAQPREKERGDDRRPLSAVHAVDDAPHPLTASAQQRRQVREVGHAEEVLVVEAHERARPRGARHAATPARSR